jgi:hypothetical protein
MTLHKGALVVLNLALFIAGRPCFAEPQNGDASKCSTVYENHNQTDYGPLKVHEVRGSSLIQVGSQAQQGASGACLVLFTEEDHKVVASVVADVGGHFEVRDVAPGRYRLVARAEGLCTANIPLEVVTSSRRKQEIVVHFRPAGLDTCSYGELSSRKGDSTKPAPTMR